MTKRLLVLVMMSVAFSAVPAGGQSAVSKHVGRIAELGELVATKADGKWGLAVTGAGMASVEQPKPVAIEFYKGPEALSHQSVGYERLDVSTDDAVGIAHVAGPEQTRFTIEDHWRIRGPVVELARKVVVEGAADGGF